MTCGSKQRDKLLVIHLSKNGLFSGKLLLSAAQEKKTALLLLYPEHTVFSVNSNAAAQTVLYTVSWVMRGKPMFVCYASWMGSWTLTRSVVWTQVPNTSDHTPPLTNIVDFHARSLDWKDNKTTFTPQMEETRTWFISGSFSHITARITWNLIFLIRGCTVLSCTSHTWIILKGPIFWHLTSKILFNEAVNRKLEAVWVLSQPGPPLLMNSCAAEVNIKTKRLQQYLGK